MINSRGYLVLFFAAATLLDISGCSRAYAKLGIKVPASATNVEYVHSSADGIGVHFVVKAPSASYRYVNYVRDQVIKSGYILCKKSAISNWQPLPTLHSTTKSTTQWIVEMYASQDYRNYILLRVDEHLNTDGATQTFFVADQNINSKHEKSSNIKEFCG